MDLAATWSIARQEFVTNVRNKWTLLFAVVFASLAAATAYFGMKMEGYSGMQNFERTSASLLNMTLYIIPLVALSMGTLSFTLDRGSTELLFSQPLFRGEILLGKWLGLLMSITLSTFSGFSAAGTVIFAVAGTGGMMEYSLFVIFSVLLAMVFLAVAVLVSTLNRRKAKTFGFALFLWFFFVLFYDLLTLGASTLLRGENANTFLFLSLFGNPVDMVRVSTLIILESTTVFGAPGAALVRYVGGEIYGAAFLCIGLLLWTGIPLIVSAWLIRRQDV